MTLGAWDFSRTSTMFDPSLMDKRYLNKAPLGKVISGLTVELSVCATENYTTFGSCLYTNEPIYTGIRNRFWRLHGSYSSTGLL